MKPASLYASHTLTPGLVIFAKDIRRVSAFYQATLGLQVAETRKSHELLTSPMIDLVIHAIPAGTAKKIQIDTPPALRSDSALKPAFVVENLKATRSAALNTGGGLKPESSSWEIRGARVLDGWDPEGNVVQFKQVHSQSGT